MNLRTTSFCFFAFALSVVFATQLATATQPNVVLILADDLGWSDLACYGSDLHETPNLDRLSEQGVRFTNAYSASPVCSPTRASILTGKHPARLNMTIWRESAKSRGNRKLLQPICNDSLSHEEVSIAELFKEAGYYNVHLGKWHVGTAEGYPQVHGFHQNIGGTLWGAPQTFWFPYNGAGYFSGWRYVPDLEPGRPGDYLTDALTDKAIALMKERSATKEPFFINLWYHTVHTPIEGKPDLVTHYENKITGKSQQRNPYYAAMVHSLDENVGRLLTALDELKISDNTLVIFSSDNGGFVNSCKLHKDLQVADNSPLRSGKGSCYEGGVRVPLIVRGAEISKSKECDTPVYSCDFFPTLAELCELETPTDFQTDGLSLVPLLHNTSGELERDSLFFHYPHYYPTTTPVSAIRKDNWKLLEYFEDGQLELYNLDSDIGESKNLATQMPDLAQQLKLELHRWRTDVDAKIPEPNPDVN